MFQHAKVQNILNAFVQDIFFPLRSAPALHIPDCTAGLLDQMNALTAWLDNSNVYGSNEKDLNDIRLEE